MILSAGIVPVYLASEPEFLVLRAYRYWDFPKGVVEKKENPLSTAIRELREETGLGDPEFCWGEEFYETQPYARGKIARYYVARVLNKDVKLSPEHAQFLWLPYTKAKPLFVPRVRAVLDWAALRVRSQG